MSKLGTGLGIRLCMCAFLLLGTHLLITTEVSDRSGRQAPICLVRYDMLQTNMAIHTCTVLYTKFNYYYSNHGCSNIKLTWLAAPLHVCNASAYKWYCLCNASWCLQSMSIREMYSNNCVCAALEAAQVLYISHNSCRMLC